MKTYPIYKVKSNYSYTLSNGGVNPTIYLNAGDVGTFQAVYVGGGIPSFVYEAKFNGKKIRLQPKGINEKPEDLLAVLRKDNAFQILVNEARNIQSRYLGQEYFVTSNYVGDINENSYNEKQLEETEFLGKRKDCRQYCKSQGFTFLKGLVKCTSECKRSGGVDSTSGSSANVKISDLAPPTPSNESKPNYLLWGGLVFLLIIIIIVVIVIIKRRKK